MYNKCYNELKYIKNSVKTVEQFTEQFTEQNAETIVNFNNVKYRINNDNTATAVGLVDKSVTMPIYIIQNIYYNEQKYRVVEIGESAFENTNIAIILYDFF